jgi:hypothetical protein
LRQALYSHVFTRRTGLLLHSNFHTSFHAPESEELAKRPTRELSITMQELIDKVLNGEFDEAGDG